MQAPPTGWSNTHAKHIGGHGLQHAVHRTFCCCRCWRRRSCHRRRCPRRAPQPALSSDVGLVAARHVARRVVQADHQPALRALRKAAAELRRPLRRRWRRRGRHCAGPRARTSKVHTYEHSRAGRWRSRLRRTPAEGPTPEPACLPHHLRPRQHVCGREGAGSDEGQSTALPAGGQVQRCSRLWCGTSTAATPCRSSGCSSPCGGEPAPAPPVG